MAARAFSSISIRLDTPARGAVAVLAAGVLTSALVIASPVAASAATKALPGAVETSRLSWSALSSVASTAVGLAESPPVLVEELTTETSSTFLQPDGSYQTVVLPSPVNYLDGSGDWHPIDNSLVPSAGDAWAVENAANDYRAKLPTDASADPVRFSSGGQWVSFALEGADGAPKVDDSEATFDTDVPDTTLSYEALGSGLKESLTLSAPPAGPVAYVFDIGLSPGLTPRVDGQNNLEFVDGQGVVAFRMPAPFMLDSAQPEPATSSDVDYELTRSGEGWSLTLVPDAAWLSDPARVYPVVIDPTVTADKAKTDCYIAEDEPADTHCGPGWDYLRVGVTSQGNARRALLRFDLSKVPANATVTSASMKLYLDASKTSNVAAADYSVRRVTRGWDDQVTWKSTGTSAGAWSSPGGDFTAAEFASRSINGSTGGYKEWTPSALVADWVSGAQANHGLLLKQAPESTNSMLAFYSSDTADSARWPTLTVNYNDATPAGVSGAGERRFYTFTTEKLTDRMQAKVNVGNGNLLLSATDAKVAGVAGLDLVLQRYYNTALADTSDPSKLGPGWSTGLGGSVRLEFPDGADKSRVLFWGPSGYRAGFAKNAAGDYVRTGAGFDGDLHPDGQGYKLEMFSKSVYLFNSAGQLTALKDKQGNQITFTYTSGGALDYATDTRGRKADFSYRGDGMLDTVEIQAPGGAALLRYAYTYTPTTPARLASSRLTHVNTGALPNTSDAVNVGAATSYAYDAAGRLAQVKDPRETTTGTDGGTTRFGYDSAGRVAALTRVTDDANLPDSRTGFAYSTETGDGTDCYANGEAHGTDRTVVNGERTDVADTTTYCVDDDRRVVRTVDANGHVRSAKYGPNSNVVEADMSGLGSGGQTSSYTYDSNDNPTGVKTPTGGQASASYGDATNPHMPTAVRDFATNGASSAAPTWAYDYDDKGQLIEAKASGPGITYRYCYDGKGLLQRIDSPDNATGGSSVALDNDTSTGCGYANQGNDTLLHYDGQGQLTKVDRPGVHGTKTFTYDALSRVKTATDGRGVRTSYTYDGVDRVVAVSYDDDPNDAIAASPAGDAAVSWTYDPNGNLTEVGDLNGRNTFGYDELNRKVSESAQAPSGNKTYVYDPADNVRRIEVSDEPGATIYSYDKVNLVESVNDQRATDNITTFHHDRRDKRDKTVYPNGIVQEARYDDGGKLTCVYSYVQGNGPSNGDDTCPAATFSGLITYYKYDYTSPAGFDTNTRYKVTELGGTTTDYRYDPITRLTSATTKSRSGTLRRKFTYEYDRHSNLTKETVVGTTPGLQTGTTSMAYNDAEELCWSAPVATSNACGDAPIEATRYDYDGAGSLTSGTGGNLDGLKLAYNLPGQTTAIDPAGSAGPVPMAYDGVMQDRRTQAGDVEMSYGFAGLSAQSTNSGQVHAEWFVRDPGGGLVGMVDRNDTEPERYYLTDGLGSVIATVNSNKRVCRYLYEPYGQEIRSWCDTATAGTTNSLLDATEDATGSEDATLSQPSGDDYNPWRYASGYYDRTTGMLKFGTRYYMSGVARWTQVDPKSGIPRDPTTLNPYGYVGGNPTNSTDLSGRDFWELFGLAQDVSTLVSDLIVGDYEAAFNDSIGIAAGTIVTQRCVPALIEVSVFLGTFGCYALGSVVSYSATEWTERSNYYDNHIQG